MVSFSALDCEWHPALRTEQKCGLLEWVQKESNFTAETVMNSWCDYQSAFSKLSVRELRLRDTESTSEQAFATKAARKSHKCHKFGIKSYSVRECWRNDRLSGQNTGTQDSQICLDCEKLEDISRNCKTVKMCYRKGHLHIAVLIVPSALLTVSDGSKSSRRMMDSACTWQACDEKNYVSTFTQNQEMVQVENSVKIQSFENGTLTEETIVDGSSHNVLCHDAFYAPDTTFNSIS